MAKHEVMGEIGERNCIMASLAYRPDWESARARLTTWWHGGDIGRPALQLVAPCETPAEIIQPVPEPAGWITNYSPKDFAYRQYLGRHAAATTAYFAEAAPAPSVGDLAPNCLALYLGCDGVEMPGTMWCRPFITEEAPAPPQFRYNPDNAFWRYSQQAFTTFAAEMRGKSLQQFPDLIEGLDTLEGMRGAGRLLEDLYDRPEWVHACLRQITDRYFYYYDMLYDILRDEVGGSYFWAWAPGRMAKFQCDFSAMISPAMFGEFMAPILTEMTERVSYCMYHWDGPGAIPHHDHLLAIPHLDMLQWTPGAGAEPLSDPRWWPLYHKTIDAGKKLFLWIEKSEFPIFKREFGEKTKQMMLCSSVSSRQEAEAIMHAMEC